MARDAKSCSNNSPKGPPDIEAHGVEPEERRQEEEVHRDG